MSRQGWDTPAILHGIEPQGWDVTSSAQQGTVSGGDDSEEPREQGCDILILCSLQSSCASNVFSLLISVYALKIRASTSS